MIINVLIIVLINSVFISVDSVKLPVTNDSNGSTESIKRIAEEVITRVLGIEKASFFEFIVNKNDSDDGFSILKTADYDKVSITGRNAVSLVWGVNYYLKSFCNCHISWDGDHLHFPISLPLVNITIASSDKLRYYQNVCTSSYSFVWWDWKRWEREIDWMAFNGINLALAFTAQEAIWQRVYDGLGLMNGYFTGPAFLAWNRMGNLRNFAGGLFENWHKQQISLQHNILKRMRDIGITPILPAFCGVVPKSFNKSYPETNLIQMARWSKFSDENCCPFFLDPKDPLFSVVNRVFMREYISEFGTDHFYNCDTFNENTPPSSEPEYLSSISHSIYREISSVDPSAIWIVQGWMFNDPFWIKRSRVKAFLSGVPVGKMLILDLQSGLTPQYRRLENFYGHYFIWCMLHNFGGQLGMYGYLSRVNEEVQKGRSFSNSTMVGIGITPEGIGQNYIVYDFMLESSLHTKPVNLSKWVSRYAMRRYGIFDVTVDEGWQILKDTVYDYRPERLFRLSTVGTKPTTLIQGEHISKNILTKLPSLNMKDLTWYNRTLVFEAFLKFVSASQISTFNSSELFQHDLIDITRQTIQLAVGELYFKLHKEYRSEDIKNFQNTVDTFLKILDELDTILGSGKNYLLGNWLEGAKSQGKNSVEKLNYEFNARNQITLWGPNGEIRDYAAKQWSGLVSDYYKPRWNIFLKSLNQSLVGKIPFNLTAVKKKIFKTVEEPFGWAKKTYPTSPKGNPIQVIYSFAEKWKAKLEDIFKNSVANQLEFKYI